MFNDTIEYGKAVVFLSNVTTTLISGSKRFIRLKPLVDLRICEVEVSSFPSGTQLKIHHFNRSCFKDNLKNKTKQKKTEQDESYIKWIAITTSSVIFFLLVILILVVLCFQCRSKYILYNFFCCFIQIIPWFISRNNDSALKNERHSNSKNEYSLTDHRRAPRPPGSGIGNPGHSSFNSNSADHADYYEEIIFHFGGDPLPQLNSNSANDLL